jgi:hypothetical protein
MFIKPGAWPKPPIYQGSGVTPVSAPNQPRPRYLLTMNPFGQNVYANRAAMILTLLLILVFCIVLLPESLLVGSWTGDQSTDRAQTMAYGKLMSYRSDLELLAPCIPGETLAQTLPLGRRLRRYGIMSVSHPIERSLRIRALITSRPFRPPMGKTGYG